MSVGLMFVFEMAPGSAIDVTRPRLTHRPFRPIGDPSIVAILVFVANRFQREGHDSHHYIINVALFEECLGSSGVLDPSLEKVCPWIAGDDDFDSSLDNRSCAVHARRVSNKQ